MSAEQDAPGFRMGKLNHGNATWTLDEAQSPCDVHFVEHLKKDQVRGSAIFHFGTGNHHIVALNVAEEGAAGNVVLAITASPQEHDDDKTLKVYKKRLR